MPVRILVNLPALLLLIGLSVSPVQAAAPASADKLSQHLSPWLDVIAGRETHWQISGKADVTIAKKPQQIQLNLTRLGDEAFDFAATHRDYAVRIQRDRAVTRLVLPRHRCVFVGRGEVEANDHLQPGGLTKRLISSGSVVAQYLPIVQQNQSPTVALLLTNLLRMTSEPGTDTWRIGEKVTLAFDPADVSFRLTTRKATGDLRLKTEGLPEKIEPEADWSDFEVVEIPRRELERQLTRGMRRVLEVLAPSAELTSPVQRSGEVPHGSLQWHDGQRLVLLHGSPEQIGQAHGTLLRQEALRCIDSVLYAFGTVQTVRTGRWFRHDLDAAYKRLAPHIPADHRRETRALASGLGIEPELAEALNVFPELFHCSGFALFGKATTDGKLYHGRVLDYMTTIGLQDAATTFIVAVDGKIPFANIGYAGFIGSVSGMNARAISLGEMGGRGEGQWDGVPMATLMRRALEECSTLDDVKRLWTDNPRTCEYYYVFADGKSNQAVGVAATPESIEFIAPGQAHPRLGEGIEDAVVLSAGSRLKALRSRVQERYGKVDSEVARWLMSRPVAMESNLHNVLFVPADGIFYVANASHRAPAAERPYVRFDLNRLLETMPSAAEISDETTSAGGGQD